MKVNRSEEDQIGKENLKGCWSGDKKGRIRNGSEKGRNFEKDDDEKISGLDQKAGERIEKEREEGSGEAQWNNEETDPGNDEEVG